MNLKEVIRSDNVNFTGIESSYFLLGLLSAFENRFQAMADSTMKEISWKQFFVIICINLCKKAPTVKELAEIMGSSHQNVKQILLKLEKKGFVSISVDEQDKRKQRIELTPYCQEFCEKNDERSMNLLKRMFEGVSEEQLQITIQTIIQIEDNLRRFEIMSRGIILYQSKYGATKKYVDWLVEELGYDYVETKDAKVANLLNYDVIILGGGVYASGIAGLQFLKKNIGQLTGKKIAVFAVGASPYEEKAIQQVREMHFKDALSNIPSFYCRGAWDEEKMKFTDRTLCKMLQKAVAKQNPDEYEPWQKALMCAVGKKCDWTDKSYLEPLLKYIEEF